MRDLKVFFEQYVLKGYNNYACYLFSYSISTFFIFPEQIMGKSGFVLSQEVLGNENYDFLE